MTRVLHVIHGLGRGGLENGVINLLNGLPEDIEQAVVCLDIRGEMAERIQRPIEISVLDRGRHDFSVPFELARIIRQWRPDVIHARNWNAWADAVAGHRLSGGQGRLVWSFHGFPDGQEAMPFKRRLISRILARLTDGLFAVCRDAADRYSRVSGVDPERFEVIYNGVDTARFQPVDDRAALRRALGMPEEDLVIVSVASLTPVKDHISLLEALGSLAKERLVTGEGKQAGFWFVGEGALRQELENKRAQLGLEQVVHMPGASDRVPDWLAAADAFILPSRLEGMSNAIIEAMAAGLPVIAKSVGGNPELIEDGASGFLAQADDVPSLAAAISQLLSDSSQRQAMGLAARQRAQTVFSIQAMMDNYADYYRRMARG